jgi:hypothetical protein
MCCCRSFSEDLTISSTAKTLRLHRKTKCTKFYTCNGLESHLYTLTLAFSFLNLAKNPPKPTCDAYSSLKSHFHNVISACAMQNYITTVALRTKAEECNQSSICVLQRLEITCF